MKHHISYYYSISIKGDPFYTHFANLNIVCDPNSICTYAQSC